MHACIMHTCIHAYMHFAMNVHLQVANYYNSSDMHAWLYTCIIAMHTILTYYYVIITYTIVITSECCLPQNQIPGSMLMEGNCTMCMGSDDDTKRIIIIGPAFVISVIIIITIALGCCLYQRRMSLRMRDLASLTEKGRVIIHKDDLRHANQEGRLIVNCNVSILDVRRVTKHIMAAIVITMAQLCLCFLLIVCVISSIQKSRNQHRK